MLLRAGQRMLHVPGIGITTSRRAVSAGGEATYVIDYDGSAAYADAGSAASLDNLLNNAVTVEAWINPDTSGGYGTGAVCSKGNETNHLWLGYANYTATPFAFQAKTGDTYTLISAQSALSTGAWHHVAGTYDNGGDKVMRLWIDGTLAGSSAAATGSWITDASDSLTVARQASSAVRWWDGKIGWMRISNTVRYSGAFTPIARCSPPETDANTVALWRLTEGSGNPQDTSGNANHLALTSGTWSACS